ncbi:uncharacterized protein LOC110989545 [Acanthaster planci]|uniref:Uncharacterized protein LOC110989545 n=1 Tax=Acanthaster planci TaxID=133434 RepID=A0A8B7ZVY3_ACAPL|nr:uncharacterized protein LOC110989545 [Acanthaster planci]
MEEISNENGEVTNLPEVDIKWCEYCPSTRQEGSLQALKETLPHGYQYICCQQETSRNVPRVDFRVNIKDELSAKEWLAKYQETTLATWRTARTYPNRGSRTLCRLEKRCQHMTCPRSKSADLRKGSKNTNCPAVLIVIVRRTEFKRHNGKERMCRSEDHHLPKWPMTVVLKHDHNHPLKAANMLRHRDVSKDVRKKLIKLFRAGHSATSALNMHQYDLQIEHGDDYVFLSGDRHHNPDLNFTWRLYNQIFGKAKTNQGERPKHLPVPGEIIDEAVGKRRDKRTFTINSNPEMVAMLQEKIDKYNLENGDCVRWKVESNHLVMAIVTPLMKRTHALIKYAGEMVFMDASGTMSRHNTQVFMMMTPSFAGGLPLGAFITTGDSKQLIQSAIQLGQDILGDTAFYGRGMAGPEVFFTDDIDAEKFALEGVYPGSTLILCIYQVLQAFWKHLFDPKFKIHRGDGPYLFEMMKAMLYASSDADLEVSYQNIMHDDIANKYSPVKATYLRMYERRTEWALCYRNALPLCGNNTSNYCESAMRILKDKIFHRAKTYTVVQLVDFLLTRMDQYYQKRLLDVGHNRLNEALASRYISSGGPTVCTHKDKIIQESAMVFLIPNEKPEETTYRVDMTVGLCTCRVGSTGGPCCHQKAVLTGFYIPSWNFIPVKDEAMRELLFQIGGTMEEEKTQTRKRPREDEVCETDDFDLAASEYDDTPLEERKMCKGTKRKGMVVSPKVHQKKVLAELDAFVARIKTGYLNNPCVYKDALEDFVHQTKKFKTDAELVCALYTFGE